MSGSPQSVERSGQRQVRSWRGLRHQWKLLGLFEIDQEHEFYRLTCMMKEGLAAALHNTMESPPENELSDDSFKIELTQIHKDFTMKTFAGPLFAGLRSTLGVTEREYQNSLCSDNCFLQFISNSKSKADFFITSDKRFFLKTQNKREIQFLLANLKIYMDHLKKYPHSLLVKFLGVHRIKIPNQKKKYFIVMQSVFYPDDRIHARYDIKGCEVSRWTDPAPEGSQVIVVLKDLNFQGQYINLDQQRSWILCQVEIDTRFLQRLNVLDYSLLLAHQPLHRDERHQGLSFASLIMRAKQVLRQKPRYCCVVRCGLHRFVYRARAVSKYQIIFSTCSGGDICSFIQKVYYLTIADSTYKRLWKLVNCGPSHPGNNLSRSVISGSKPGHEGVCPIPGAVPEEGSMVLLPGDTPVPDEPLHASTTGSAEPQDIVAQNRRLLPTFRNPLHVIDGPEQRYFIGIIDIFTVYSFRKRLEHLWKRIRYPGRTFSTVSPSAYCLRMCHWLEEHTK